MSSPRRVGVVTGGGGGIGAAIAEEMGRDGWYVVTVDPLVTVDGSEQLPAPRETTAGRILAAGGQARASSLSVTDGPGLRSLFEELVAEHGRLDAVVNVAGITRPTGFGRGGEEDWRAVLEVHVGGYLNVLAAALPVMAAAGRGRIVGVTSGSGWRAADAGAYSRAKRAVASLTWQLGRVAPPGVTVNALSPIAATRMVTAALSRAGSGRAGGAGGAGGAGSGGRPPAPATGGLSLASMPEPGDLGPIGAYMAGDGFGWSNGRVLFAAGSEVAIVTEPHLLEAVDTGGVSSVAGVLEAVLPRAFVPAEAHQASQGGTNARFAAAFSEPAGPTTADSPVRSCAIVSDRPEIAAAVTGALGPRGVACHPVEPAAGFEAVAKALRSAHPDPVDAVIVALSGPGPAGGSGAGWEKVLDEHRGVVEGIYADSGWASAAVECSSAADRPVRLVTLTDATTAGGRSRAQAAAQAARVAAASTKGRVTAFAAGIEAPGPRAAGAASSLVAHLLCYPEAAGLAGAELAVGDGWIGLRSHPAPAGSVSYPGPAVPGWLGAALRDIAGEAIPEAP